MKLTENETDYIVMFLSDLSNRFGTDASNDIRLPNTRATHEMCASACKASGDPDNVFEAPPKGEAFFYFHNGTLVDYLIHRLQNGDGS